MSRNLGKKLKINLNQSGTVIGNIFSGSYGTRASNTRGKIYEFSSPSNPVTNFKVPFGAKLEANVSGDKRVVAAGERKYASCPPTSDRSGVLYFAQNLNLIGTCHGAGSNEKSYYNGYSFYNSFYPAGYIQPPFGENIAIFNANTNGYDNLINGSCNSLSVTEYNEQFGIVSKSATNAALLSTTLVSEIYSPIYSPAEACPPDFVSQSYYDEVNFTQIHGNTLALGGNNFYNSNPVPTSLDNFDIKINGRYSITTDEDGINTVLFTGGRPISSYGMGNEQSKLNNTLCPASLMETRVSMGKGTNGVQLMNSPDVLYGAAGDQVNFAGSDPFYYWHFTFRENANGLPFTNNFVSKGNTSTPRRSLGEGTPLFIPILSSEESYWKNRQCPDVVDYLPWTFGGSIYACPSEHFDIPYYAAIKKFGFYGTRFLNTCKKLNLDYELSGVENAIELPTGNSNMVLGEGEIEPDELDGDGNWSFSLYNNLLKVAKAEEAYSNMYALNKGFFLWANSGNIASGTDYQTLTGQNSAFDPAFKYLINKFQNVFTGGLISFTGTEPSIFETAQFNLIASGNLSNVLATNEEFDKFKGVLNEILTPNDIGYWTSIENTYSHYVALSGGDINQPFYQSIISGREKRLSTRYFENVLRGNAVDLFPLNNITFSFDKAKDYIEHTGWGRRVTTFGKNSDLPEIQRRYFEGAYGNASKINSLTDALARFSGSQIDYYYPGFFNEIGCTKESPTPTYVPAVSGTIVDNLGRSFSPSGWLGLGYNEIGALDGKFSCFTPHYTQQPVPKVFCKIGQKPTFRVTAVDYHTLPEDKISRKYPEIIYWASKLKMLDCGGRYLYPLKYKWYRIPKDDYEQYLPSGNFFDFAEASNPTGNWACLEGDTSECTLIHPNDSYPVFTGVTKENQYTFIKGAVKEDDDDYYYMCLTSGRFGIRRSNISELQIEDWLRFDMSVKNGINAEGEVNINFIVNDYEGNDQTIEFEPEELLPNYGGYQRDLDTVPETIIEEKVPPPNAGWGDVKAFRFTGPMGYIGATRSYKPSVLTDTRGLRETWGHMLEYGQLLGFSKDLSQEEGDSLYGYKHLPTCENYQMPNGKRGIKIEATYNGFKIGHWSLPQKAVASLDNKVGIQWNKLLNLGELYPPINSRDEVPNFGIGHWQWGNNLGAIKRFGKFSNHQSKDITFVGNGSNTIINGNLIIQEIQERLIGSTDLAGGNCGYVNGGLGRNMLYYVEAYERFYIICDPLKKKNVSNKSFLAPGLRFANSALQYFWLGKPTNTYLKRRPMYGPYAYQWRVQQHNRDRNGNGISEALYSMGHGKKYDLLYDAPATYGLYSKNKTSSSYKTSLTELATLRANLRAGANYTALNIRNTWFGEKGNEGGSRRYGSITYSCDPNIAGYDSAVCDYVSVARSVAENIDFGDHACSQDALADGQCFDPCLSMRYGQGFFPGGKSLDLIGNDTSVNINDNFNKNVKIVPIAKLKNDNIYIGDEKIEGNDRMVFRNPLNTPHARIHLANNQWIAGITPCQDGGADHCNYITPTIHLNANSSYLIGLANIFTEIRAAASAIYG